jgi:hypothetical protein
MDGVGAVYERLRGRSFATFVERLAVIRSVVPFGINFVLNEETFGQLDSAAEFAFKEGAKQFLILPEVDHNGGHRLQADVIQSAKMWITSRKDFCRLASSDSGAALFGVPTLPVSRPMETHREFLHVDAFGYLRRSAFVNRGVLIASEPSIIAAIQRIASHEDPTQEQINEDLVRLRQ